MILTTATVMVLIASVIFPIATPTVDCKAFWGPMTAGVPKVTVEVAPVGYLRGGIVVASMTHVVQAQIHRAVTAVVRRQHHMIWIQKSFPSEIKIIHNYSGKNPRKGATRKTYFSIVVITDLESIHFGWENLTKSQIWRVQSDQDIGVVIWAINLQILAPDWINFWLTKLY